MLLPTSLTAPPTSTPEVQDGCTDEWAGVGQGWVEGRKLEAHPRSGNRTFAPAPQNFISQASWAGQLPTILGVGASRLTRTPASLPWCQGSLPSWPREWREVCVCVCVSGIHLVPRGRGRVGLDILYSENYTTPAVGPWTGHARLPRPVLEQVWVWGGENGRKIPS